MVNEKSNFTKGELKKFRRVLFPLIADETITGYNHYPKIYQRKAPYLVNYLHANLGKYDDGRDEEHKAELIDKIKKSGLAHLVNNLNRNITERIAIYKLKLDWLNEGLKLYDKDGNQLSQDKALLHKGVIIGEGKQHDLSIDIENESDLNGLLDLFRRTVNKYKLDNSGNLIQIEGKNIENIEAIIDSWEVPIILVAPKHKINSKDYKRIKKITIGKNNSEISALVDKTEPIVKTKLDCEEIEYMAKEVLANQLCYNWVNKE